MQWDDRHNLGIERFDFAHRRMFDLINKLYDDARVGGQKDAQLKLINELIKITKIHFTQEELAMSECGYAEYLEHIDEHLNLIQEVEEIKKDIEFVSSSISQEQAAFLINWLLVHIIEVFDQLFS